MGTKKRTSAALADLNSKLYEMNHDFDFPLENLGQLVISMLQFQMY
ncbi:MAG: hypothetical protein GZ086_08315 [Gelidibacter sp.]|nr:hypothetical protein [Gelidibacter sp.]